jgi:hypothetical protein
MPPVVIAGAIAGAASIGGGILAKSASDKATKSAAQTAQNTANSNNALTQGIYNQNSANLRPFMESGGRANALLDNLLYGYQAQPQQAQQQTFAATQGYQPNALGGQPFGGGFSNAMPIGQEADGWAPSGAPQGYAGAQPMQGAVQTSLPPQTGLNAWDAFRNSTNYQFRLGEGLKAANQGYAANGTLQSGAAMKGLNNYAQNFASNELGNWMNMLGGQQNLGLSGASALAGVGQNMVSNITANNNSASSAAANAALMNGQTNANLYGGIANSLGTFAGSLGSSFKKPW